ncbi:MAG: hypothetical protein WBE34_05665 [Candidatus Nitrosopolaris sp.]
MRSRLSKGKKLSYQRRTFVLLKEYKDELEKEGQGVVERIKKLGAS